MGDRDHHLGARPSHLGHKQWGQTPQLRQWTQNVRCADVHGVRDCPCRQSRGEGHQEVGFLLLVRFKTMPMELLANKVELLLGDACLADGRSDANQADAGMSKHESTSSSTRSGGYLSALLPFVVAEVVIRLRGKVLGVFVVIEIEILEKKADNKMRRESEGR
ncbi:hypothetical protein OBBRIDRAFT_793914 [Obba rivulosa]|uniref:Uncharacterized protein n=1 Tax=Obba rivulosa TaxID=1052685 RepID=A0A8E2B048_9APHY|nr:hypothetical protein OBBRIDRAFT_793914 [Obba rivulosa]